MPAPTTTEKLMQTFRMERILVTFLKSEATRSGIDLTAHVTRILDGVRTWFGLPAAARSSTSARCGRRSSPEPSARR